MAPIATFHTQRRTHHTVAVEPSAPKAAIVVGAIEAPSEIQAIQKTVLPEINEAKPVESVLLPEVASDDIRSKINADQRDFFDHLKTSIRNFSDENALATIEFLNNPKNAIIDEIHDQESITTWARRTFNVDPDRYQWHLRRACGFGGSDVGTIANPDNDDPFTTAKAVVESKLLMSAPFRPMAAMEIGAALEANARNAFKKTLLGKGKEYLATSNPEVESIKLYENEAAFRALNRPDQSLPEHPWVGYSPDDVLVLEVDGIKHSMMIDYKVKQEPFDGVVLQRYKDQVIYGTWLINELAKKDSEIIPIDLNEIYVCTYAPNPVTNQFQLHLVNVEYSPERISEILTACDAAWELRQKGQLPELVKNPEISTDVFGEKEPQFIATSERLAVILSEINALGKEEDALKASIKHAVNQYDLGEKAVIPTASMNVRLKASINTEKAVAALLAIPSISENDIEKCASVGSINEDKLKAYLETVVDKGVCVEDVVNSLKDKGKTDEEKLKNLLIQSSLEPKDFQQYEGGGCSPRLIVSKKNERIAQLKAMAGVAVQTSVDEIYKELNPIFAESPLLDAPPDIEKKEIQKSDNSQAANPDSQTDVDSLKKRKYTKKAKAEPSVMA